MSEERKRPAFEPPAQLIRRTPFDPDMKRPAATVAGAVLVLLRVAAGALWVASLSLVWPQLVAAADAAGAEPGADVMAGALGVVVGIAVVILGFQVLLAVLILRGRNWPRVTVMSLAVLFISTAFVGWWFADEVITLETTLISVALDVLILLALSSRDAAAYARRGDRGRRARDAREGGGTGASD